MLENYKNSPGFKKLVEAFDLEPTSFFRRGVPICEPEKTKLADEFCKSFGRDREEISTKWPEFSFYRAPITSKKPYAKTDLRKIYMGIRGNYYKSKTLELRNITDKDDAREFKTRHLDFITVSGIFKERISQGIISKSEYMVLDLDDVPDLISLKEKLKKDPHSDLIFTSPSGTGLKWIVSVDLSIADYHKFFAGISDYLFNNFSVRPDKSGKDICRACFLSWDPQAYINPKYI